MAAELECCIPVASLALFKQLLPYFFQEVTIASAYGEKWSCTYITRGPTPFLDGLGNNFVGSPAWQPAFRRQRSKDD